MSGKTMATSDTRIEALQLQSSAYGVALAVMYGTNRIAGNMLWYGGFKAVPHTTSTAGKGGTKTQNTTYTYTASVMMGLCEGQISGIPRAWKGKKLYTGGPTPAQLITVTESYTVAGAGIFTTAHSAAFSANLQVVNPAGSFTDSPAYWLSEGSDYTRVGGVYTFSAGYLGVLLNVTYTYLQAGATQGALTAMGLSFNAGAIGQAAWSYLTSNFPAQALGYSGIANVTGLDYDLGTGAQVENHTFEVQGPQSYSISTSIPDANPASATFDLLTNGRYGAAFPSASVGSFVQWSNYCLASGLLLSPTLDTQMQASDFITQMAAATNTAPVWSAGKLKMIPYGDKTLTLNGATYTPNVTPIYDLTDDDYAPASLGDPIKVTRTSQADAFNHVRVEFLNRDNLYNVEIAEAKDSANIETYGLRTAPTVVCHWCCDAAVARNIAQLGLQRALYVRNTYEFVLPIWKAMLEPMDLLTLTDAGLGFNKLPVRITQIDEGQDLTFTCEDFPLGVANSAIYSSQAGAGFQHDYNVSPGNASAPFVFELPQEFSTTGLQLAIAATSAAANWGGCQVWVSNDGTNYAQIGTIYGGSRYGALAGAVSSTVAVTINSGALASGSAADLAALSTLCFIGGASPEYIAYQTATLTGTLAYTLGTLATGLYGTTAAAHAAVDPFVRVDSSVVRSDPLKISMIGKTISVKLPSFNVYGGGQQSLASVTATTYTITGYMAKLPPPPVSSFTATVEPFGIRLACSPDSDPNVVRYEYRVGSTFAGASVITADGGTGYLWQVQTLGSYTFWVAAVDVFGNYSTPVSAAYTLAGPTVGSLASAITGGINLGLTWTGGPGSFAIAGYEVRYGAVYASATVVDFRQTTSYLEALKWVGSRLYWVAAIDVKGNYGTPSSLNVTVNGPSVVTGARADVVDNNALLYWTAPAIGAGQLAIDHYEVRKGVSFAGGTVIGSNGNSTFTGVFEQASGTFTYWVAAVDTAGNVGTAVSIVATINQPPDYVLRNNYDSAFPGTFVNFYSESGGYLGPVDLTQTWATHFTSNSWTTPDNQISAGFPIYADPSLTSGSYEETIDYGAALPTTVVTVSINTTLISGAVTVTPTLSWKLLLGDPWTVLTAGASTALLPAFRYIRVHYDFTCTAGANLIRINALNVKLAIKLRTDSGSVASVASGGTAITFGYPFIAADTPIFQPAGATPLIPVVIYSGGVNPTGFTIKLYNTSGTDVGSASGGSWTARGY